MKNILCNRDLKLELRLRLVNCFIFSILLYGVEAWTVSEESMNRLNAFEMWIYRRVSWVDRISDRVVLERIGKEKEIEKRVKTQKLKYFGHIMRNQEKYNVLHLIIQGKIYGRRPPGRRKMSWLANLRKWFGQTSVQLFRSAVNKIKIANMIANVR